MLMVVDFMLCIFIILLRKLFKINENESTTFQNLWFAAKCTLAGKITALSVFIRKVDN
jgi:hypothetical protein